MPPRQRRLCLVSLGAGGPACFLQKKPTEPAITTQSCHAHQPLHICGSPSPAFSRAGGTGCVLISGCLPLRDAPTFWMLQKGSAGFCNSFLLPALHAAGVISPPGSASFASAANAEPIQGSQLTRQLVSESEEAQGIIVLSVIVETCNLYPA